MGYIKDKLNINNKFGFWSIFSLIIFLFLLGLKIIPAALTHFNIWYPLDDAYIYHQFALNLTKGHFLTYSIGEPHTNGNSSFLYYLVYSLILFVLKPIFAGDLLFKVSQVAVIGINFVFFIAAAFFSKKLLEEFISSGKPALIFWLLLSIFTVNAVLFSSFSGLEVALTTFLVTIIAYSVIVQNYRLLFISMIFSNLNRPENLVMNAFLLLFLYYGVFSKKIKFDAMSAILFVIAQVSLFMLPLINYMFLGTIFLSSMARTGAPFGGKYIFLGIFYKLLTSPTIIFDFFLLPLYIPGSLLSVFKGLREYLSVIMISFVSIILFWSFEKKVIMRKHLLMMLAVFGYFCLPFLLGITGEWQRYLVPIFPILLILFYGFVFQFSTKLLGLMAIFVLGINLLLYPVWVLYSFESINMVNKMMLPMANYIATHMKPENKIGIDQAGLVAVKNPGITIDVYGLGTQRYAKICGKFDLVYDQIRKDNLDYFVTWPTKSKHYYLDSAHYAAAYENSATFTKVFSTKYGRDFIFDQFPKEWVLYKVNKH